jgi:hypothetical protein
MSKTLQRPLRAALLSLALPTLACGTALAQSKPMPFKATLKFSESVGFTGAPPCFAIGLLSGSGQATQLGGFSATSQDCINPDGLFDPNGPTAYHFTSGAGGVVFTAANGDRLLASYSGSLVPQAGRPHAVTGHFIFTGGTGRFAGAVGGGVMWGTEDISQVVVGTGQVELLGTLSSP